MDVSDLLDSDQRILAHSKRLVDNGQSVITFDWGDGSPPFKGLLPAELSANVLQEWCAAVRGAYNARQDRPTPKKDREAAVVRGAPEQADPPPRDTGGSGLPIPQDVESVKATLAAGIEATLAELGRRRAKVQSDIRTLEHERAALHRSLSDIDDLVGYYEGLKEKL